MRTLLFVKEHHDSWQRELGTVGFPSSQGGATEPLVSTAARPQAPDPWKGTGEQDFRVQYHQHVCVWRKDVRSLTWAMSRGIPGEICSAALPWGREQEALNHEHSQLHRWLEVMGT